MHSPNDHELVAAPPPTWPRYRRLFLTLRPFSVLRQLQYEALANIQIHGKVLDFGGGASSGYHRFLSFGSYESINIDPAMRPTWVTNAGQPLPTPDNHYDTVLCLNTLEHVYDARFVVEQLQRALRPGGFLIATTPFLYPVHANPDDFFRPTWSWWTRTLRETGFCQTTIVPLLWGPFSTGAVVGGGPLRYARLHFALFIDLIYYHLRYSRSQSAFCDLQNHPLGYFIHAQK